MALDVCPAGAATKTLGLSSSPATHGHVQCFQAVHTRCIIRILCSRTESGQTSCNAGAVAHTPYTQSMDGHLGASGGGLIMDICSDGMPHTKQDVNCSNPFDNIDLEEPRCRNDGSSNAFVMLFNGRLMDCSHLSNLYLTKQRVGSMLTFCSRASRIERLSSLLPL